MAWERLQGRRFPLSRDGVAGIQILGAGEPGEKSLNLLRKAPQLERSGFLFPRRNIVVTSDVLIEVLGQAGLQQGWHAKRIGPREIQSIYDGFLTWVLQQLWPHVEQVFEGRALYVRSDASRDALGRGVYRSIPFVNRMVTYGEPLDRPRSFARKLFNVVLSHFDETAVTFRRAVAADEGMSVLLSQFIGRKGSFLLEGQQRAALAPFLGAVVKSNLLAGRREGLVRFEYGLGSGALVGRSLLCHDHGVETLSLRQRSPGISCRLDQATAEVIALPNVMEVEVPRENWPVIDMLMLSAYPISRGAEAEAGEMLSWIVEHLQRLEQLNGERPLYLELVASSFKRENRMRWFVVQAADLDRVETLMGPPQVVDFLSNKDFSGHGVIEGRRQLYIFGSRTFESAAGRAALQQINAHGEGFVVILPQHAFTGLNLTSLEAKSFLHAAAVIEYERLSHEELRSIWHREGPSSEHFEQLMLDLKHLFIPVDVPFTRGVPLTVGSDQVVQVSAEVRLVCDKERGVAWGCISGVEPEHTWPVDELAASVDTGR